MRGEGQSQLRENRHHQHDDDDGRHLPQQAERRRNGPFRHITARQHHVFGNRPAIAVSHRHALDHKQAGEGCEHVRNTQDDDQKRVEQPHQRAERKGNQNRLGSAEAVPDEKRYHQRVCQRRGGSHGEIEPADGQRNRYANVNHRHDGDRAQYVDDIVRIEEVVRGQAKHRHQRDDGQQHAPLIEKIENMLTA